VEPTALRPGGREHLAQGGPEPQRAVPDREHRGAHPAPPGIAQQVRPRAGRLPLPVGEGDQLLGPVGTDPDQHQQAQPLFVQPDVEVDAVGPHVHVVDPGQVAGGEGFGLVLPRPDESGDDRAGQACGGTQELLQCRREIQAGQAVQVQQRQHLVDLRALPAPRRQDRRGEPPTLTGHRIDTLIVHPRRDHLHRPRGREHFPRLGVPVPHHQPPATGVDLVRVRLDIRADLGPQRRREHRPRTLADDLIQHTTASR
jgi:hypothetical protein